MMNPNEPEHVYHRQIDPSQRTSLSVVAGLIAERSRVLDLGTGTGALGDYLTNQKQCVVDGVTYNEQEAALARPSYRRVQVADLETCSLEVLCGSDRYDFIVCADVLEHIKFPQRVLLACRHLLAPGGRLILSVPNASYCGLVGELMAGEFRYRDEGLLDHTHVKFFTRQSLLRFVEDAGWYPHALQVIEREVNESEFRQDFDRLPPAVARYLLTLADAMTYQLVLVAALTPADHASTEQLRPLANLEGRAAFSAQLYLGVEGQYAEDRKVLQAGAIGELSQTLVFPIPEGSGRIDRLRFDPADRPGYLHLYRMALLDKRGSVIWSWRFEEDGLGALIGTELHQLCLQPKAAGDLHALALLLGDDPWIELPLGEVMRDPAMDLRGGKFEVELGWPMSADYRALAMEMDSLRRHSHALETEVARLRLELEAVPMVNDRPNSAAHAPLQLPATVADRGLFGLSKDWLRRRLAWPTSGVSIANDLTSAPTAPCVDVIVPVYSGLDDTRRCIESVLASLCLTRYRLVIINDASPEPAITEWLRHVQCRDARVELIENDQNLGFVASVNRGMALSQDTDVVLLNSDTEVANDWLDRLRNSAHSHERVGSVTPFSNNATICSYPRFCQNNSLPAIGTRALDRLFAECNAGEVVDVPTGVGFCLYIRRDCLQEVGLFDIANFGKGYGEENDFCVRAANGGWRNLHALDVFVHHAGGVSFGESKGARELAAMETLRRLHPDYEPAVHRFLHEDPARLGRERVDRARIAKSVVPVVLLLLHNRGGGTARHVQELAQEVHGQALFLSLMPVDVGQLRLQLMGYHEDFQLRFDAATGFEDLIYTLKCLGVDHVHFHHIIDHCEAMRTLPARLGVTYDFTAHDFYSYCPQVSLTDYTRRYCGEKGLAQCLTCLKTTPSAAGTDIQTWRRDFRGLLMGARNVFAPSQDAARRLVAAFPGIPLLAVSHTDLDGLPYLPIRKPAALRDGRPLRVVVLGALSDIKGASVMASVALAEGQRQAGLEIHLLGYVAPEFVFPPGAHVTVHGRYEDTELLPKLAQLAPDLIWFPAQWPETYSYTLSAALQSGFPIVAPDFGAFGERLAGRNWTWLRPWNDSADQWLTFFETVRHAHFAAGSAPEPAVSQYGAAARIPGERWSYRKDYVKGLTRGRLA
jgi:GT2 family glycosyltransferase/2-polyprenyl-3-methyl-5-hydroxy-6-metoxy-1,4-benzoquinol methylase